MGTLRGQCALWGPRGTLRTPSVLETKDTSHPQAVTDTVQQHRAGARPEGGRQEAWHPIIVSLGLGGEKTGVGAGGSHTSPPPTVGLPSLKLRRPLLA